MKTNRTANACSTELRVVTNRKPRFRRAIPFATSASLAVALALSVPSSVAAEDEGRGRGCSDRTLRGDYGLVSTGTRAIGPERRRRSPRFAMVTYNGNGTFTAVGVSHGQTSGVRGGSPITGTYFVNADCTGGQTTYVPGAPALEDSFVIVANGREVEQWWSPRQRRSRRRTCARNETARRAPPARAGRRSTFARGTPPLKLPTRVGARSGRGGKDAAADRSTRFTPRSQVLRGDGDRRDDDRVLRIRAELLPQVPHSHHPVPHRGAGITVAGAARSHPRDSCSAPGSCSSSLRALWSRQVAPTFTVGSVSRAPCSPRS